MPVSPQDFELYSRMTGAPMPTDAMSRMQMAPDVYNFTKSFARKPNLFEKTGNLVKNIGRGAVMALGAPLVAASVAEEARMQEQLRNQGDIAESDSVTMENPTEEVADTPAMAKIRLGMEAEAQKQKNRLEIEDRRDARAERQKQRYVEKMKKSNIEDPKVKSGPTPIGKTPDGQLLYDAADLSTQEPTTADTYGQDYVPNQTSSNIVDRKISQGSQIADSTPNVAEVLSESQDSTPVDFVDAKKVQQQMEAEMVGKSMGKRQLSKFMGRENLDKALLGAIIEGKQVKPEMFGQSSPVNTDLLDHPDVKDVVGGEEPNPMMGTNTNPTTNLQEQTSGGESLNKRYVDHADEMRRMEAQERRERMSPSEKQVGRSPNELAGKDQAAFEAIQAGIPQEEQEAARMRIKEKTSEKRRQSTAKKADDFKARFVEGALSDIVRGARSKKSLGITRIPATNGDAQVGFVLADKAVPEIPKNVPLDSPLRDETGALRNPYGGAKYSTTYGFGVASGAEDMLQNQIRDKDSFSSYYSRGLGEAKEGKRRKAGEIFEFLPKSRRVVQGTASLGDIVM